MIKRALASREAFSLPVILVLGLPSAITLPLTERISSTVDLLLHLGVSIFTLTLVALIAIPLRSLTQIRNYRYWFTPVLAFALGGFRGTSAWLLTDRLDLIQQSLLSRALYAGLSWAVLLPLAGYFYFLMRQAQTENRFLRNQIARARSEIDSLDQQRAWLAQAQVQGLDRELAEKFVGLSTRLNDRGLGAQAQRQIALELRELARDQVRPRSIEIYKSSWDAKKLIREFLGVKPNASVVALAYVASAGLNNLRVEGLTLTFFAQLAAGAAIWLTLLLAQKFDFAKHLVWLSAGSVTIFTLSLSGVEGATLIGQFASAMIWSQALAVATAAIQLAIRGQRDLKLELEQALDATELDIQSLTLELEAGNLEIAKYLHAILQTRLMAYALQLERGQLAEEQLDALLALLASPMREFERTGESLDTGLERLRRQWQPLVEVEFSTNVKHHGLDAATLQVIREAIANSVHHGLSERVQVEVRDEEHRRITVSDNGIGPRTGDSGMGTMIFYQLCRQWQLTRNRDGGATFTAII